MLGLASGHSSPTRRSEWESETDILRVSLRKCGNFCEAESMMFHASTAMVLSNVLRSRVLIASLGFSSITRDGNARANFFQNPAHVEKDCFPPQSLSFEMPYHEGSNPNVLAGWWIAEELAEMGPTPLIFSNNGVLSNSK